MAFDSRPFKRAAFTFTRILESVFFIAYYSSIISLSILIEEKFANNPVIIREDEEIFINIGWVIISFIIAIIFVNFMNLFFMVMNLLVD